jgi:prepilin-type N-terminal cleavage/methylation domain-containing protein
MIQNMNQFSTNRPTPARCPRFSVSPSSRGAHAPSRVPSGAPAGRSDALAFTLIELLVVIAIIGLLAALIVSGAGIATVKARTYRVQAERDALITAIQQYKEHKGYYPQDNTNSPFVNALYYELTGVTNANGVFISPSGDTLTAAEVKTVFGVDGFVNVSPEPGQPAENFFKTVGKSTRTSTFYVTGSTGHTFTLFGIGVPPGLPKPFSTTYTQVSGTAPTLWNYVSTNPTNNSSEFDLWMDVAWSGKTNRISNWSKDPQVIH